MEHPTSPTAGKLLTVVAQSDFKFGEAIPFVYDPTWLALTFVQRFSSLLTAGFCVTQLGPERQMFNLSMLASTVTIVGFRMSSIQQLPFMRIGRFRAVQTGGSTTVLALNEN